MIFLTGIVLMIFGVSLVNKWQNNFAVTLALGFSGLGLLLALGSFLVLLLRVLP